MIEHCKLVDLPTIKDSRGNLTFIETEKHVPFNIKRVYYVSNIPEGAERGGHAHKALLQLIVAVNGSFDINIDDGYSKKTIHLNRSDRGLFLCPMIWREINNFSSGAICMALVSELYDEADYYRDYPSFLADLTKGKIG